MFTSAIRTVTVVAALLTLGTPGLAAHAAPTAPTAVKDCKKNTKSTTIVYAVDTVLVRKNPNKRVFITQFEKGAKIEVVSTQKDGKNCTPLAGGEWQVGCGGDKNGLYYSVLAPVNGRKVVGYVHSSCVKLPR